MVGEDLVYSLTVTLLYAVCSASLHSGAVRADQNWCHKRQRPPKQTETDATSGSCSQAHPSNLSITTIATQPYCLKDFEKFHDSVYSRCVNSYDCKQNGDIFQNLHTIIMVVTSSEQSSKSDRLRKGLRHLACPSLLALLNIIFSSYTGCFFTGPPKKC